MVCTATSSGCAPHHSSRESCDPIEGTNGVHSALISRSPHNNNP